MGTGKESKEGERGEGAGKDNEERWRGQGDVERHQRTNGRRQRRQGRTVVKKMNKNKI